LATGIIKAEGNMTSGDGHLAVNYAELLELGLSVPQVTKIFLKLREMGVDVPADVYTIPYAVKTLLEAKRRRDAGESLVLPRSAAQKGGAV
jgi:energy-coupling factor transport system ATP-binding protein